MRESWTDERMDDLSHRMDQSFGQVRTEIARVDADVRELHTAMNTRFDALQRTLFLAATGVIASLVGLVATQL